MQAVKLAKCVEPLPVAPRPTRLRGLDGLRGLAALAVVLFHYSVGYETRMGVYPTRPFLYFWNGHFGVELFFCLSGFVILGTVERTADWKRFAVARFARIYPAYLVCALISLFATHAHLSAKTIALNATMLTGVAGVEPIDPSYWTLNYEVLFYAAAAEVWFLYGRRRQWEVPCLIWLACSAIGHTVPWVGQHHRLAMLLNVEYAHLFVLGMMLYRLTLGTSNRLTLPTLCAALLLTAFPPEWNSGHLSQAGYAAMILTFAAAIWLAAKTGGEFLNIRPLVFLGDISYSLYLIHQVVGYAIIAALLRLGLATNAAIFSTIGVVIAIAFCLRKVVEKPAERWLKRTLTQ